MRTISATAILLLLIAGRSVSAAAGPVPDRRNDPAGGELLLDHALFMEPDSAKARLELYYQLPNPLFEFTPTDDGFRAEYEVIVRVRDKHDHQVASFNIARPILVSQERRTRSAADFRLRQVSFWLDPGNYEVEFIVKDKSNAKSAVRELKVKVPELKLKKPQLSDIEFVMARGEAGGEPSPFDKGTLTLVPSLTHVFGADGQDRVGYYVEIYRRPDDSQAVFVETSIRRRWGSMVYRDSMTTPLEEPVTRQYREVSLADLAPGEYELQVVIRGRRHKKLDQRTRDFKVAWSQEAMLRNNYDEALKLLSYIASSPEMKELEAAETYEQRLEAVNAFWLGKDPSPGTPENEVKIEFYRRVRFANDKFEYMRQPGWRSDRGRVYIKHGEPDQIDDYPISADSRPYQVWHYYRGGGYRKFTFVDENEDGDYRLAFPYDGLDLRPDF